MDDFVILFWTVLALTLLIYGFFFDVTVCNENLKELHQALDSSGITR